MITKEVIEYLRGEISRGTPNDIIKKNILKTGWTEDDFAEMMQALNPQPQAPTLSYKSSLPTATVAQQPQPQQPTPVIQPAAQPVQPVQTTPRTFTMPTAVNPLPTQPQAQAMPMEPLPAQSAAMPQAQQHFTPSSPTAMPAAQPAMVKPVEQPRPMPMSEQSHVSAMPQPQAAAVNPMAHTPVSQPTPAISTMMHGDMSEVPAMTTMPRSSGGGKKKILIIGSIVLALLLIAGAVYGYVGGYFVSLDKVTANAFAASHQEKTATFDMTLAIDTSTLKQQTPDLSSFLPGLGKVFTFTMKGSSDATDPQNPKSTNSILISAGSINAALDMRIVSGTIYAALTKAPLIGILPLSQYENKWFSFPLKQDPSIAGNPAAMLPVNADLLNSLTTDQKNHLFDLVKNAHLITITKRLSPESINGTLSYHFTFDIDHAGIKAYINSINDYIHEIGKNDSRLSSVDLSTLGDYLDGVHSFNGEMWIGIMDHLPQKVSITAMIGDKDHLDAGDVKLTLVLITSNWGKPVTVDVPANSTPFTDFISQQMNGSSDSVNQSVIPCIPGPGVTCPSTQESAQQKGMDATKKSILTNMRAQAELYYSSNNNSYTGLCSSDNQGLHLMAKKLPSGSDYKCRESSKAWAASVNLSTNDYFCTDSTGQAKNESGPIPATACQ